MSKKSCYPGDSTRESKEFRCSLSSPTIRETVAANNMIYKGENENGTFKFWKEKKK